LAQQGHRDVWQVTLTPVATLPCSAAAGLTAASSLCLSWAVVRLAGPAAASSRAAAPATCGAAMLVPVSRPVLPPGSVDKIRLPGAAKWTTVGPKLE
jgi:hypothetical protein